MPSNPFVQPEDYPLRIEVARTTDDAYLPLVVDALTSLDYVDDITTEAPGWMIPTAKASRVLVELHIAGLSGWPRKPGFSVMTGGWGTGVYEQAYNTVIMGPKTQEVIRHPPVMWRSVVVRDPPSNDHVVSAIIEWLTEYSPRPPTIEDRLTNVRNRVEQLLRETYLRVLENQDLHGKLAEQEIVIGQLEAQVKHLEDELRRERLSKDRVGLSVLIMKYILGPAAIAAAGSYVGVAAVDDDPPPPAPFIVVDDDPAQLRLVERACDQVLHEIERLGGTEKSEPEK